MDEILGRAAEIGEALLGGELFLAAVMTTE